MSQDNKRRARLRPRVHRTRSLAATSTALHLIAMRRVPKRRGRRPFDDKNRTECNQGGMDQLELRSRALQGLGLTSPFMKRRRDGKPSKVWTLAPTAASITEVSLQYRHDGEDGDGRPLSGLRQSHVLLGERVDSTLIPALHLRPGYGGTSLCSASSEWTS